VDKTGTVVDRYSYDVWGVPTISVENAKQPLLYAGYWYDRELGMPNETTGWYWLSVRAYDPALKRFLQPDPSGIEGLRSYVYVGDDPADSIDPTGLMIDEYGGGGGPAPVPVGGDDGGGLPGTSEDEIQAVIPPYQSPAEIDQAIEEDLKSPDISDKAPARLAVRLRAAGRTILRYSQKVMWSNGQTAGDIDIETDKEIIEYTTLTNRDVVRARRDLSRFPDFAKEKDDQLMKIKRYFNPNNKRVVFYAKSWPLEDEVTLNQAGIAVVHNDAQLLALTE
jgi:RHS repeat-associated protein